MQLHASGDVVQTCRYFVVTDAVKESQKIL